MNFDGLVRQLTDERITPRGFYIEGVGDFWHGDVFYLIGDGIQWEVGYDERGLREAYSR